MFPDPAYCGGKLLRFDQACLHIFNNGTRILEAFSQSTECYKCSLSKIFNVHPGAVKETVVQTTSDLILEFNNGEIIRDEYLFGQHGHYNVSLADNRYSGIVTSVPPQDAYAPLKVELWILLSLVVLWMAGACTSYYLSHFRWIFQTNFARRELLNDLGRRRRAEEEEDEQPSPLFQTEPPRRPPSPVSARIQFIDAFRGLAMVLMVFVNYGGGKYWFFEHAPWNGLTFADIVFPSFAFVMGMSELLSISSLYRSTHSKKKVLLKVFLRSLVLILLGIILNSFNNPNLLKLRIPGVLQRLGLAYFMVGVVEIVCIQTHLPSMDRESSPNLGEWLSCCGLLQWIVMLSLVLLHSCTLLFVQLPGCPKGYLGPGGLHLNSSAENCTGGVSRYIDQLLFSSEHLYYSPNNNLHKLYHVKVNFDPEGLLGVLTTSFTVFLGVCATRLYLTSRSPYKLMLKWIELGLLCGLTGGFLCNWSKEDGFIPINKRLWSLSYALVNGAIGFLTISLLYFLIDYKRIWNGSPFRDVGKNAILIYIGHAVMRHTFPWDISPIDMSTHTEILLLNTWSTFLWLLIAVILSKNNIIFAI